MDEMITARQIRAARGLLEWSGDDLAKKASMTRATLSKIESDLVQPQEATVARLAQVLDIAGVEFLDGDGVKMRQQEVRVFSGKVGYRQFLDHIFLTLKHGGRVRQFNLSDGSNLGFADEYGQAHLTRMGAIDGLDARVLTYEGDLSFPAPYCTYRWIQKDLAEMAPFYLYGDFVTFPMHESSHKREWVSISSKLLTERYARQFDVAWSKASVPPKKKKK
jgi:transcriptional regulator with XRE-family HTH domain